METEIRNEYNKRYTDKEAGFKIAVKKIALTHFPRKEYSCAIPNSIVELILEQKISKNSDVKNIKKL